MRVPLLLIVVLLTGGAVAAEDTVLDDLIGLVQSVKYPRHRPCDVIAANVANSEFSITPGKHVTVNVGYDHKLESIQKLLQKKSSCAIVVAETHSGSSMRSLLDLVGKKGDSMLILVGAKYEKDDMVSTEKSVLHLHNIPSKGLIELSVLCKPKTSMADMTYVSVDLWTRESGFLHPQQNPFAACKHPLEGRTLNVSYQGLRPYVNKPQDPNTEAPSGTEVQMVRILAQKFDFRPAFVFAGYVQGDPKTGKRLPGGVTNDIVIGKSKFGIGIRAIISVTYNEVDTSTYIFTYEMIWATRNPQRLASYDNLVKAFPSIVWVFFYVGLLSFSVIFAVVFVTYKLHLKEERDLLSTTKVPWLDFLLLPMSRFVSSDPLPWFPRYSTGKFLVLLWSVFILLMIFFYTCNLRAHLIAKKYESPVRTNQDVIKRGRHVYIQSVVLLDHLKQSLPPDLTQISVMTHNTKGGWYNIGVNTNLPSYAREDVMENGAVYLSPADTVLDEYTANKSLGFPHVQTSDPVFVRYCGLNFLHFMPWKRDVDRVLAQFRDMGFHDRFLHQNVSVAATVKWSPTDDVDQLEKITLEHLLMALVLIVFGLSLGLVALAAEWLYHRCQH